MANPIVVPMGERRGKGGGGSGGGGRGHGGGGASAGGDWQNDITRGNTGKPESTVHNTMLVLEHDHHLAKLFELDEFANVVRLQRKPFWAGGEQDEFTELDGVEVAAWLGAPAHYRLNIKPETVLQCVEAHARRRKKHPVREYLSGLEWDGVPRVEALFPKFFTAEDSSYTRHAAQCFLVSAVARILWADPAVRHNGAQVDFMLVLEGEQGKGKTSAVRALFGAQWYAEAMESPTGKDFYQSLRGRWCVEIGEMDSFTKADVTKVKQAITARFDTYRPSYGRVARSFRRECVFVGTTNDNEYLRDPTGGRRFLPVRVDKVDIPGVIEVRDQLWAEAVHLFREGFQWWELPEEAAEHQDERFAEDSWQGVIQAWIRGDASPGQYPPRLGPVADSGALMEWTTTTELLSWALGIDVGKHGKPEQMRISSIMKRLHWKPVRPMVKGDRERRWMRPAPAHRPDAPEGVQVITDAPF